MIRRFLLCVGGLTILFAGIGFLSYVRQFGYVGSWQSFGLRQGKLTYVTRITPISDGCGLFVDGASEVNRAMFGIGGGVRWWMPTVWPWVEGVLATVAYSLIVPPIRRRWRRPAPRWLVGTLVATCVLLAALWTTSRFVTVTFDTTKIHFSLREGEAVLVVDRQQSKGNFPWGTGWNVYRRFPPYTIYYDRYVSFRGGNITLKAPLGALFIIFVVPTVVLARTDRRAWPGHCSRCGYDLTGNESGVCPECGTAKTTMNSSNENDRRSTEPPETMGPPIIAAIPPETII